MWTRRRIGSTPLILLAGACLALGAGAPLFQAVFLSAASDLGTAVLWAVVVLVALVLGATGIALGAWRSDSRFARWARIALAVPCALFTGFEAYVILGMLWTSFIGPTAVILLPEGYSGRFQLTIAERIRPSLATRQQRFTYVIPADGLLHVDRGWIDLHFRFRDGVNILGGPYHVQIVRVGQGPLKADEFSCKWQEGQVVGIECEVQKPQE